MKKILFVLPLVYLLSACLNDNFIDINKEVITGVVQIVNIPDVTPTTTTNNSTTQGPGNSPVPQSDDSDKDLINPKTAFGSGFIVAPNVIITNYHVIDGENHHLKIYGYNDMKPYVAHIVVGDPTTDIAILKIDDWDDFVNFIHPTILNWGHSAYLQQGEKVWAIGHPYGMSWSLSAGLISSLLREDPDGSSYYMQTDTSINPGNSGGPLFNANGEVVGINSAIFGNKGYLGLTIPGDYAKKIINDLLHGGKIKNAKIGIIIRPSYDNHNILVNSIYNNSNALKAGLLPNDIINAIYNPDSKLNIKVKLPYQLRYQLKTLEPDSEITIYIIRDHTEHLSISFKLE